MEPPGTAREDPAKTAGADGPARARPLDWCRIAFGGKAFDCVLMDVSAAGARVYIPGLVDVPDLVTLRFPGGESRPMRCCWQTGPHVGLLAVEADLPAG